MLERINIIAESFLMYKLCENFTRWYFLKSHRALQEKKLGWEAISSPGWFWWRINYELRLWKVFARNLWELCLKFCFKLVSNHWSWNFVYSPSAKGMICLNPKWIWRHFWERMNWTLSESWHDSDMGMNPEQLSRQRRGHELRIAPLSRIRKEFCRKN